MNYTKEQRRRASAKATHIFAALHSVVAFTLANTVVGDKPFLTILTVLLILVISKIYDSDVSSFFKNIILFCSFVFGSTLALAIVTAIPVLGNLTNAGITVVITEIIGFLTYKTLSNGESIENLVKAGKMNLIRMFISAFSAKKDFLEASSKENEQGEERISQSIYDFGSNIASSMLNKASLRKGEPNINFLMSTANKFFMFSDKIALSILESV